MKLLIVDEHPLIREGIAAVLSVEATIGQIEQAATSEEAVNGILNSSPDIVLMDIELDKGDSLNVIPKAREMGKSCKFVIITSSTDYKDFQRAESFDVDGYILKDAFPEEILLGIKLISRGRKYYDPAVLQMILDERNNKSSGGLTPREKEVLMELGKGKSNKQIAERLFITEYTVKKHVSQILSKLNLADRTQAALYANSNRSING
ncbi:MAG: response regulator transcription factor [Clostridiales bacterium]|nr:response regulator transcription factor [Clostridiales bacterium]